MISPVMQAPLASSVGDKTGELERVVRPAYIRQPLLPFAHLHGSPLADRMQVEPGTRQYPDMIITSSLETGETCCIGHTAGVFFIGEKYSIWGLNGGKLSALVLMISETSETL